MDVQFAAWQGNAQSMHEAMSGTRLWFGAARMIGHSTDQPGKSGRSASFQQIDLARDTLNNFQDSPTGRIRLNVTTDAAGRPGAAQGQDICHRRLYAPCRAAPALARYADAMPFGDVWKLAELSPCDLSLVTIMA